MNWEKSQPDTKQGDTKELGATKQRETWRDYIRKYTKYFGVLRSRETKMRGYHLAAECKLPANQVLPQRREFTVAGSLNRL